MHLFGIYSKKILLHGYTLSAFTVSQPHASYACHTHGLSSKWTFLCRTIPNISELFRSLEEAIRYKFLPDLTGQLALSDVERDLLALPSRLGGLGIINPVTSSDFQHLCSITYPLLSRHLSFNNLSHILSPARNLKGITNEEQYKLNTREN